MRYLALCLGSSLVMGAGSLSCGNGEDETLIVSTSARRQSPPTAHPAPSAPPAGRARSPRERPGGGTTEASVEPPLGVIPSAPNDGGSGAGPVAAADGGGWLSPDEPDASPPVVPACTLAPPRCEGRWLTRCNTEQTGIELARDCREPALCEQAVERCELGGCTAGELGCSLPELLGAPAPGVQSVGVGANHSCAVLTGGAVRCWGVGASGRLGYGHEDNIGDDEIPALAGDVRVGGAVAQISANGGHTCALLVGGSVRCWGEAAVGQLGYGNKQDIGDDASETPASAGDVELGGPVIQVVAGGRGSCALLADGRVRCWGDGSHGQLGLLTFDRDQSVGDDEPAGAAASLELGGPAAFLAAGGQHVCALRRDGRVLCWGRNHYGQLGYGHTEDVGDDELPVAAGAVELGGRAVHLAAGTAHTCAVLFDGSVRCWGDRVDVEPGPTERALGDDEQPTAIAALRFEAPAIQVAAGNERSCVLLETGAVYCWFTQPRRAFRVELGDEAVQIAAQGTTICAITSRRELHCWGNGINGSLGYGNTDDHGDHEPATSLETLGPVPLLPAQPIPPVPSPPLDHLPPDPPAPEPLPSEPADAGPVRPEPRPVADAAAPISRAIGGFAVGESHSCAFNMDGVVRCWGHNADGQLGLTHIDTIGDDETPASARSVDVGGPVAQLALGDEHTCALLVGGDVRCWGYGHLGRLGYANELNIGDDEAPASAGSVDLGGPAVQLSAGGAFTCALLFSGDVRCWGSGTSGKLGILTSSTAQSVGDNEAPASLAAIELGEPATSITSGHDHSCAVLQSGALICWGRGTTGQLGNGSRSSIGDDETPASVRPVALGGIPMHVSLGVAHSCAVLAGGAVRCWGASSRRVSGHVAGIATDGVPEGVPLLDLGQPALQVAAGQKHTCALLQDGSVRCWGDNQLGQLGGPSAAAAVPVVDAAARVELGGPAIELDATGSTTCALLATRELVCWGDGSRGNLGYGVPDLVIGDDETPASMGPLSVF